MPQYDEDPEAIHFWFRDGSCVISGKTFPVKELIKQGEFTYIGNKRIWLVTPARGWQLSAQIEALGFPTKTTRCATDNDPDATPAEVTKLTQRSTPTILPFTTPPDDIPLSALIAQVRELTGQLILLAGTLEARLREQEVTTNA